MITNHSRKKILVVDSTSELRASASQLARSTELDLEYWSPKTSELETALSSKPDLIVLDATFEPSQQLSLLQQIQRQGGRIPVVVVSPAGVVSTAVAAMKCGASEIVEGGAGHEALLAAIETSIEKSREPGGVLSGVRLGRAFVQGDFGAMVGSSPGMRELFSQLDQIAHRDTTVLITGESGTGNELIAREMHIRSSRRDGPFIAINCAAIPETLIESELFGHERGAFTNAVEKRIGHVELAHGGTLFLDEIGELSPAVQVKLLRFLQEQEFYRVGRSKPISVDCRVITATNRDLEEAVKAKLFRQDLLYRINVINLHVPALRDRREDIPRLVSHCVAKLSPRYGGRSLSFAPEALSALCAYCWPGNVRELENVLEGLLALVQQSEATVEHLPRKVREGSAEQLTSAQIDASGLAFGEAERIFETEMIVKALQKANFVQTRAAQMLGITRRILKYKMDKLGINDHGEVGAAEASKPQRNR